MAKKSYYVAQLINSEEKTKTKYIVKKPSKGQKQSIKLELMKYDPVVQRHCLFKEKKLPNPKK